MKFWALIAVAITVACTALSGAQARTTSAWGTTYYYGLSAPTSSPLGQAIIAIKTELRYNGYDVGMNLTTAGFGKQAAVSAKAFQRANGLYEDGVVGPITARYLLRKRALFVEATYGMPNHYLARLKTLESANDPGAIGFVDPDDHGPVQINLRIHSDVTLAQATAPSWCLPWAGRALADQYAVLHDWEAAVAAWNVGSFYAARWLEAGKPSSGYVVGTIDWFARAHRYVDLVKSQNY